MKKKLKLVIPWRLSPGMRKTLLYMKLTFVILLAAILQSFAVESYSQNANLSIKLKNARVQTVLQQIEKQSEFYFLYSRSVVDVDRIVDVDVKNAKIFEVLDELFDGTDVAYKVEERQIVLSKKENETTIESQQQKSISGKVTGTSGETLPGVSVVVKGTTTGVITDNTGSFSISNVPGSAILQFSFVGMKTQEIAVGTKTIINVKLSEETIGIEEVVAVGYGTQKKMNVTGSISTINSGALQNMPVSQLGQRIQGKLSGVRIYETSGIPGGSGLAFRIRGQASINAGNSPLVVIDGFPSSTGIESINPEEVASISVLKDASSTSLYGSRAANGVILITTKQASEGAIKIGFSFYTGIQNVPQRGRPDVMNAREFAQYKNEWYSDNNMPVPERYQNPEQYGPNSGTRLVCYIA